MRRTDHEFQQDYLLGELPSDDLPADQLDQLFQQSTEQQSMERSATGGQEGDQSQSVVHSRFIPILCKSANGSQLFLNANPRRNYLAIQNNSGAPIVVNFDANASEVFGVVIQPGILESWDRAVPTNGVYVWASQAGLEFVVLEGM